MRSSWIVVFVAALAAVMPVTAQSSAIETLAIQSSWGGLGTPRRSDLLIERKGDRYVSNGRTVSADEIQALLNAIHETPIASPNPANLGVSADWLREHVEEGGKNATYFNYEGGSDEQKALFRSAFTDEGSIQRRLNALYQSFHTDDYPHVRMSLKLTDGTAMIASSDSQHPFMLPWKVTEGEKSVETYNANISRALSALVPHDFTNRESLNSGDSYADGLVAQLGSGVGSEIRVRWESLGAQTKAGSALAYLSRFYEIKRSEINSYYHLEYGEEWKGGHPQEENLHTDLWRAGFLKGLELGAVLLRHDGKVEGAESLHEKAKPYEQLVLSIDWLRAYLDAHPSTHVQLFYVHDRSFTDRAMKIFAADMKRAGRQDLVSKVRAVQDKAALFETADLESSLEYGEGDYWIALPDRSLILWRWQSLSHVLLWSPSTFPVKECADYRTVTGGCSGATISPEGRVGP